MAVAHRPRSVREGDGQIWRPWTTRELLKRGGPPDPSATHRPRATGGGGAPDPVAATFLEADHPLQKIFGAVIYFNNAYSAFVVVDYFQNRRNTNFERTAIYSTFFLVVFCCGKKDNYHSIYSKHTTIMPHFDQLVYGYFLNSCLQHGRFDQCNELKIEE